MILLALGNDVPHAGGGASGERDAHGRDVEEGGHDKAEQQEDPHVLLHHHGEEHGQTDGGHHATGGGEAGEDPRNLVLQEGHDVLDHEGADARGDEDGNGAGQEEAQGAGPEELVDGVELTGLDGLVGTVDKRDVSGHDQDVQLLNQGGGGDADGDCQGDGAGGVGGTHDAQGGTDDGAGDDIRRNISADVVDAEPHELHGRADHDGGRHVTEDDADADGCQQGLAEAQVGTELVPSAQTRPDGEQKCLKHKPLLPYSPIVPSDGHAPGSHARRWLLT